MIKFYSLLLIVLIYSSNINSQSFEESKTLSRLKLSGGYFVGEYSEVGEDSPFLNFNYRGTQINKHNKNFEVGLSFEAGINFIKGLFPVYVKAGPEARIIDNLIVGANGGFIGMFIYPISFYGFNSFYLFEISNNIYLELESGFHSPFTGDFSPIYYLNIGLSIN
jgi:hypothetical protein